MPQLSVIVPVHNVAAYLDECLTSLLGQSGPQLQVILVDDGSTDSSAKICERWSSRHPEVQFLQQENMGIGPARNLGLSVATGDFLAFCDADDVVPAGTYERMLASLKRSGSDMVSGNVRRLVGEDLVAHPRYRDTFSHTRLQTHIRHDHGLILDRMAWNKVFRRIFWDATGLRFDLPFYEDATVTVRAHLSASAVDVLSDVVYHWRIRQEDNPSVTQLKYEPRNIESRTRMVLETFLIVQELGPELEEVYAKDMCTGDLAMACEAVRLNDGDDTLPTIQLARDFLLRLNHFDIDRLPERAAEEMRAILDLDLDRIRKIGSLN